jgi:hypothetical protein
MLLIAGRLDACHYTTLSTQCLNFSGRLKASRQVANHDKMGSNMITCDPTDIQTACSGCNARIDFHFLLSVTKVRKVDGLHAKHAQLTTTLCFSTTTRQH